MHCATFCTSPGSGNNAGCNDGKNGRLQLDMQGWLSVDLLVLGQCSENKAPSAC